MEVYIMRHGQTYWNKESKKKHQTHSNGKGNELTQEGYKQAERAAEILKDVKIDFAVYTPLKRSKQTLEKVLVYHPNTLTLQEQSITEMSLSFLDGLTQEQWETTHPETRKIYALRKADKAGKDQVTITYKGAGVYNVMVKSDNYKDAEKVLDKTVDAAIKFIEKKDGEGSFKRLEH